MTDVPDFMTAPLPGAADDCSAVMPTVENPGQPAYDPNDRRSFLGGSDSPRIMGLAPPKWGTEVDLYFEKVEGPGPADPEREKNFRRGKRLEPYAVQMLEEDFGVVVSGRNRRYQDPDVPYFSAEIDFEWTDERGETQNGEIKTVHIFMADEWGEAETGDVPIHYACQAMWNLGITGRRRTMFGALFGADDLVRYWIERDDETIAAMRERAITFWNRHVLARVPPPPRTLADIGRLWPRDNGRAVEATPEVAAAWVTLQALRKRATAIENAKDEVAFAIGEHMKDASFLTLAGRKICSSRLQERTTVDADLLLATAPDVYAACAKTSEFRVIRSANAKGK